MKNTCEGVLFSLKFQAKGTIIACILSPEQAPFTFLLSTVHLFIWHYIFKDSVGRNFWNLGYGENLDTFWLGRGKPYSWGRGLLGGEAGGDGGHCEKLANHSFFSFFFHFFLFIYKTYSQEHIAHTHLQFCIILQFFLFEDRPIRGDKQKV